MDDEALVEIARNVESYQVAVIEEALEEKGIYYISTGSYTAYGGRSVSSGGYELMTIKVKAKDVDNAIRILQGMGFRVFNEDAEEQNFLKQLASPTEKIPFLARYSLYVRLSVMAITITAIITLIVLSFLMLES